MTRWTRFCVHWQTTFSTPPGPGVGSWPSTALMAAARLPSLPTSRPKIENRPVVIIHADDFLNPPSVRLAKGRTSPEGFGEDSYDYAALRKHVLAPLGATGEG